jgi:hypothetical protein
MIDAVFVSPTPTHSVVDPIRTSPPRSRPTLNRLPKRHRTTTTTTPQPTTTTTTQIIPKPKPQPRLPTTTTTTKQRRRRVLPTGGVPRRRRRPTAIASRCSTSISTLDSTLSFVLQTKIKTIIIIILRYRGCFIVVVAVVVDAIRAMHRHTRRSLDHTTIYHSKILHTQNTINNTKQNNHTNQTKSQPHCKCAT